MTIYIASSSDSGTRIVRIEGWLEGEAVAELERVIDGGSGALRLDLSELRSADKAGLAALRAHRVAGALIVGASPYIKLLLGTEIRERGKSGTRGQGAHSNGEAERKQQ
jgi:hypothetical protein